MSRYFENLEPIRLVSLLVAMAVAASILIPTGYLIATALTTPTGFGFDAFAREFARRGTAVATSNTLIYVTGVAILSVLIGVPMAFLTERTDVSSLAKSIIKLSVICSVITPGFLTTMAYINLLGPNAGILNVQIRDILSLQSTSGPFNVYSIYGILALGTNQSIAFVYLIAAASFSKMNPEFEEAALVAGAGRWRVIRTVTLPIAKNATYAGALVSMASALADFGTPHMLGFTVLTIRIREYFLVRDFAGASVVAVLLIAFTLLILLVYRWIVARGSFSTVTGKTFRPAPFNLGPSKHFLAALAYAYALFTVILPIAGLVGTSLLDRVGYGFTAGNFTLDHYVQILYRDPLVIEGFLNSLLLASAAAAISALIAIIIGYLTVRERNIFSATMDYMSVIPLGIAGTALAVALVAVATSWPFEKLGLYGTMSILLVAYVIRNFPVAVRPVQTTLVQISPELEEAARSSGASWMRTMLTIVIPLIRPGILAGAVLVFLSALTELSTSIMLRHIGTSTISTAIMDIWDGGGGYQRASAVGVCIFIVMALLTAIAGKLVGRPLYGDK